MAVMGPICAPPRAGSRCWPRGYSIQDGDTKRRTLHLYLLILTLSNWNSFTSPRGKPALLSKARSDNRLPHCLQSGRTYGKFSAWNLEGTACGVVSWCVWVGEKSRRAGRGLQGGGVFSQDGQGDGTILLPSVVPFAAARSVQCASTNRDALPLCNAGLRFLEVSKQHL